MQLVFSDAQYWEDFLPLSYTRPIAEMRCGLYTFTERWKLLLDATDVAYITEDYLQEKFKKPAPVESLFIVPNFLPSKKLLEQIKTLAFGEALVYHDELLVVRMNMDKFSLNQIEKMTDVEEADVLFFRRHLDLFSFNKEAIDFDFDLATKGRKSQTLSETNILIGDPYNLFIEEGASVECATLNTNTGKIYLGKNAEVMEGCNLRGPIALCESSTFKMNSKVYGATTIGPNCKMGGEISNVVVFSYSNKAHDGYLGNAVLGEWCNIGAGTSASNLKNNYATVKIWDYKKSSFKDTGLQFVGLIMGDHSKIAINMQINTGTVVGVAANIFRAGFPPNIVESYSWGGNKGDEKFNLIKSFDVAEKMMERRKKVLEATDKDILKHIFENF